jgi:hypothetical protein
MAEQFGTNKPSYFFSKPRWEKGKLELFGLSAELYVAPEPSNINWEN